VPTHLDPTRSADPILELSAALAPRYRLDRPLAAGGTSTAYLAQAVDGGQPVVVKVLHPSLAGRVGAERFVSEMFAASRFRHPAALPVLDAAALELGTGTAALYYVVPWADGESLRTRLVREGLLPVAEALRYAAELAEGLAAAHAQGLVHGDVRPENVLLGAEGARLADFGVARALAAVRPATDAAGDIRCLGQVLYEMLAGEPPAADPPVPLRAIRRNVPEDAELLVARALAGERESAAALAAALRQAAEAAGRAAPGSGLTSSERLVARRRLAPRWGFFTAAVLAVFAVTLWLRWTLPRPGPRAVPPPPTSIALLPLVNASPDSGDDYLSQGTTEELIADLGRVPGLRVVGPASTFALGARLDDAQRAGVRLGAGAVLEGSLRQAAGRLRVTVHLVSVREGFDLWSETYERDAAELFAVERDIVRGVAGALRRPLPPPAPLATRSLAAHARYLEARLAARRADSASVALAADRYAEAIALDSNFAGAWAGLAELALRRALTGASPPAEDDLRGAAASADRALALDSTLAAAHVVLAATRYLRQWSWDSAAASLRRALAINPNLPRALAWDARVLLTTRRAEPALARMRAASALDPLDPALQAEAGRLYLLAGALEPAEAVLHRAWLADSTAPAVALAFGLLAELQGDTALAESRARQALARDSTDPRGLAALARAAALGGRPDEARATLLRLDSLAAVRRVSPYDLATVATALSDHRRAFAWLDAALAERAPELVDLALDPRLASLRGDRRFVRIARAVGLPPAEGGDYVVADSTSPRPDHRP
jgi:TolB-like protein/Tfp pilus assembly protein PilF/tRNA A-37 threonylcarbamoyl transferase component Bud32